MGLHTGEADERDGNYSGTPLNRAARIKPAAHGGQVVVSDVTAELLGTPAVGLVDLGAHRLRGIVAPTRVFGVEADGLAWLDQALTTQDATGGNCPTRSRSGSGRSMSSAGTPQTLGGDASRP
jgi:class 3 adenylate cyclase